MFWDVAHSIILLLTCVLTPFNVAFADSEILINSIFYQGLNDSIDIFFLIDIFINMNTAMVNDENSVVIDNRCKIFIGYLKSWLLIDIISILPIEKII